MPAVLALGTVLLGGCSVADDEPVTRDVAVSAGVAEAVQNSVYLVECVPGNIVQQPASYVLACGDGGEYLEQLTWNGWGDDEATATGSLTTNSCQPSCADGTLVTVPVSVRASRMQFGEAVGVYTRLDLTTQPAKGAATTETYDLPGLEEDLPAASLETPTPPSETSAPPAG